MYTRILNGRPPRLKAPAGTCDTHIHFYDGSYETVPGTPTPPDATVADYRQVKAWLGIGRSVVVQPNAYGDDNRLTMAATAELGADAARAVVVVKPGVSDTELERLTKAGAYACVITAFASWLYLFRASEYAGNPKYAVTFDWGGVTYAVLPVTAMIVCSTVAMIVVSIVTRPPSDTTLAKFFPQRNVSGAAGSEAS